VLRDRRRLLLGLAVLVLALLVASSALGASVSGVVLKAAQIGPGYRLKLRPDSHALRNAVTLDVCGFSFASEQLRTARLQVDYSAPGQPVSLSNEVVSYRPGGAQEALREVNQAVSRCPSHPVGSPVQGVGPVTWRLTRLSGKGLLPGAIVLRARIDGTVNGKHVREDTIGVYQARNDLLSGVYTHGGSVAQQTQSALHAAAASAHNLAHR
jgi:hypothetical protein